MKVSLDWLKDYVKVKGAPEHLAEQLTMAGLEVKKIDRVADDVIFETEITTNRPDWLSHLGVAREIHAISGNRFVIPSTQYKAAGQSKKSFNILLLDPDLCPYYSATLLEDVEWTKTPDVIKRRLEACGIRSINLIVDITNYVLLEWGQPLHAFDANHLKGDQIFARRARTGEKITAIDGVVYELKKDDLVIADSARPIAIGGVMGGKETEVGESTKNILLESAFFNPSCIRATRRRLGLVSESSYRFERRVDPRGVDQARDRAIYLISKYARPKRISPVYRAGKLPIRELKITLAQSEIKRILGVDIPETKIKSFLNRLGLQTSGTGKQIQARVPSFRSDLSRPADLIEEIARIYGYDRIPETLPPLVPLEPRVDPILHLEDQVRHLCVSFGFQEAITFSLVDPVPFEALKLYQGQWTKLINPQNKELNLMRPNLLSGLAQAVRRNLYVGETDIRLFEVGNRYLEEAKGKAPKEERMLALILSGEGRGNWLEKKRPINFYDLKGTVEQIVYQLGIDFAESKTVENSIFKSGEGISLIAKGDPFVSYGTLSDRARKIYDLEKPVFYAEFSLEKIASLIKKRKRMKEIPKFPFSPRDLTVIVPEDLKAEVVIGRIRQMAGNLVTRVEVFDYFKGGQIPKDKKSLSFRIFYQAEDRTLQNEEVNQLHFSIIDSLNRSFGAELPKAKTDA